MIPVTGNNQKSAVAIAHPNIALIKYWGKRDTRLNLPATHSLSITLDQIESRTDIHFSRQLDCDKVKLNQQNASIAFRQRVSHCLDQFRKLTGLNDFAVVSTQNNFPTAAGLASSASGFAALLTAANACLDKPLERRILALLARQASGSAGRSLFSGFVLQHRGQQDNGSDSYAESLYPPEHWPLEVVIAITSEQEKPISSTAGMLHTKASSPYWSAWVQQSAVDIAVAISAIEQRDFEKLADVSEASCLAMHAVMQSARPGLLYWNAVTVDLIHRLQSLRKSGTAVFFTIDAGPQVKAICLPDAAADLATELAAVPGVIRVLRVGLGPAAYTTDSSVKQGNE